MARRSCAAPTRRGPAPRAAAHLEKCQNAIFQPTVFPVRSSRSATSRPIRPPNALQRAFSKSLCLGSRRQPCPRCAHLPRSARRGPEFTPQAASCPFCRPVGQCRAAVARTRASHTCRAVAHADAARAGAAWPAALERCRVSALSYPCAPGAPLAHPTAPAPAPAPAPPLSRTIQQPAAVHDGSHGSDEA